MKFRLQLGGSFEDDVELIDPDDGDVEMTRQTKADDGPSLRGRGAHKFEALA
jgi:hypothetical protein